MIYQEATIKGFNGRYKITSSGDIYSNNLLMKPYKLNGYLLIKLSSNGEKKTFYMHRLVAEYFIGKCPKGKEVNHKDSNKSNNLLNNLEYKTHLANVRHAIKSNNPYGKRKLSCKNVKLIRHSNINVSSLASYLGVSQSQIYRIKNRECLSHV